MKPLPQVPDADHPGWQTPFGRVVNLIGVTVVCQRLAKLGEPRHPSAVYQWVYGRTVPSERVIPLLPQVLGHGITTTLVYRQRTLLKDRR